MLVVSESSSPDEHTHNLCLNVCVFGELKFEFEHTHTSTGQESQENAIFSRTAKRSKIALKASSSFLLIFILSI